MGYTRSLQGETAGSHWRETNSAPGRRPPRTTQECILWELPISKCTRYRSGFLGTRNKYFPMAANLRWWPHERQQPPRTLRNLLSPAFLKCSGVSILFLKGFHHTLQPIFTAILGGRRGRHLEPHFPGSCEGLSGRRKAESLSPGSLLMLSEREHRAVTEGLYLRKTIN